jgi:hydrogenase maturation protease
MMTMSAPDDSSPSLTVVALGNPLRRDDGIAPAVLGALQGTEWPGRVRLVDLGQDSLAIAAELAHGGSMLLLDAADMGLAPGEVRRFAAEDLAGSGAALAPHNVDAAGVLELCRALDPDCRIEVVAIQVADVSYGEGLSPDLAEKLPEVTQSVGDHIRRRLADERLVTAVRVA